MPIAAINFSYLSLSGEKRTSRRHSISVPIDPTRTWAAQDTSHWIGGNILGEGLRTTKNRTLMQQPSA